MPPLFVSPESLEQLATDFLKKHHPSLELPTPIEEIAEFGLGLTIIPEANLYKEFGLESWLSNDLSEIHVDLYQLENFETRYRFTLAHEISHMLLHADLYRGRSFQTTEQWLEFQAAMDDEARDAYEWQARNLAGRILVPLGPLIECTQSILDSKKDKIPADVDRENLWGYIAIPLSDIFNVHQSVVFIRLSGDRVGQKLRLE